MGSWNETCALTRTPITVQDPVMVWTTVVGPSYREPAGGGFKTALLLGLPYRAQYDDYGGAANAQLPGVHGLLTQALEASGLYREHRVSRTFSEGPLWVARSARALWGLEHEMKHLFYAANEVAAGSESSYDPLAQARSSASYKQCQQALEALGEALDKAVLQTADTLFQQQCFDLVAQHFGAQQAWPALHQLRKRGLFAHQVPLFMHESAYSALVAEFSKRKVGRLGERARSTLRDWLAQQLDEYCEAVVGLDTPGQEEYGLEGLRLEQLSRKFRALRPLTGPWQATEAPLCGHFWGGATAQDILSVWPREQVLDALVFQWARSYLRLDLMPASCGTQNEEVRAHWVMHQAVYKQLRTEGRLKSDFSGSVCS